MNICSNCFVDSELEAFILASKKNGDCSFCESKNLSVYEINELYDFFEELIVNFQINIENGKILRNMLCEDIKLFRSEKIAENILSYLKNATSFMNLEHNDSVSYSSDILETTEQWEVLKNDLKWKNRFSIKFEYFKSNVFDLEVYLQNRGYYHQITSDEKLYRARIHKQSNTSFYPVSEMGCPPNNKTSSGRANPTGIPYLYLCETQDTVKYEVRASYLDELSIGEFVLKNVHEPVSLLDFTKDAPIFYPGQVKASIQGNHLLKRISQDLSKPMRRYDSELEYIPTQYICEFIKVHSGAKGIRFKSSLRPDNNIVVFEPDLMKCNSVKSIKIINVDLTHQDF